MKRDLGITNVRLDLGAPGRGPAVGPATLHAAGIVAALEALGHRVVAQHEILQDDTADPGGDLRARYVAAVASACTRLADTVELSLRAGRFPLILGGDHSLAMGSVAGVVRHVRPRVGELGVLWVDAHADMHTPQTSSSGDLHGMPLAVLLGHGLDVLTRIAGRPPAIAAGNVVVFGVREIDAGEQRLVQATGVRVFTRDEIARRGVDVCLAEALDRLRGAGAGIHLSFDLDACDPDVAPGGTTPVRGGLRSDEALEICAQLGRSGSLVSAEFVELDPVADAGDRMAELAIRLVESTLAPGGAVRERRERPSADALHGHGEDRVGVLAHSLFREMRAQGFLAGEIVEFASALLGELIAHVKDADRTGPEPGERRSGKLRVGRRK